MYAMYYVECRYCIGTVLYNGTNGIGLDKHGDNSRLNRKYRVERPSLL